MGPRRRTGILLIFSFISYVLNCQVIRDRGRGIGWRLWDADVIHRDWDVELDVGHVRSHGEDDCQTEDHGHSVKVELLGLKVGAEVSVHGAED